ncbi:MAG: restriction endonuclease [Cytophagales bacterium]|nr:restriction endonuclease [Cytophagales bacterium]
MTYREFELLAKQLIEKKLKKEFGYKIPVDHECTFKSKSGNSYKIDLSYSFSLFDMSYLTLVECKCWNNYVTREKIMSFNAIINDLRAHKGIIITTKGFQKGAITYAQSQNLGLIKITNDRSFENYSHYDGGISNIEDTLAIEHKFDSSTYHTSIGLFSPSTRLYDFISKYYSRELASFLENEYSPDILDDLNPDIDPLIKNHLAELPESWYDNYVRFETAGLNFKVQNEPELRIMHMTIQMLKLRLM